MPLFVLNEPYKTTVTQQIESTQLNTDRFQIRLRVGVARNSQDLDDAISMDASGDEVALPPALKTQIASVAEALARFRGIIPVLLLLVALGLSSVFAVEPPSAFSVEPVAGNYGWRRVQLRWTPTAPETCIYRDGVLLFCSPGQASGFYSRMLYDKTYTFEARSRENGVESGPLTVQYTPPPWTASPNVGPQRINAVFLIFPDWSTEPFSIEQAQATLNAWAREYELESFGRAQMVSTAYGWLMMPKPITEYCESTSDFSGLWMYCDSIKLGEDARKLALLAGATTQMYERVWLVYAGVAFAGYGMSLGASPGNGFGKGPDVLHHEIGHVQCCLHGGELTTNPGEPPAGDAPPDLANINANGYGDNYSHMGVPIPAGMGHYHVSDKIFFGWIDPARSKWIETSGQFWLDSAVDPNGPVVEHKVWLQEPDLYYSLEHRWDLGGALVRLHVGQYGFGQIEHVEVNRGKPVSPGGDSFIDQYRGVTISAERVEGSRLLLSYNLSWAPEPPDPNAPVDPNEPEPPASRCGDGECDEGETCRTCAKDCPGRQTGKPSKRFCCGNGKLEATEVSTCPENP